MKAGRAATTLAAYARAVERLWSAHLERPVILSSRDWSLLGEWHTRGVPLQVISEAIDALAERRRAAPPRGLGSIARAVNESITAIELGRADAPAPASASTKPEQEQETLSSWRACREGHGSDEPSVSVLLRTLLDRYEAGSSVEDLDAELDHHLPEAATARLLQEVEQEVDLRLVAFRDRMPDAALSDTRRRAVLDLVRQRLGLIRLAGPGPRS